MRVMGIDWGRARIGLALSDFTGLIASPFRAIKRKGEDRDIEEIMRIIKEEEVGEIVVGIPLNMEGEQGVSAYAVKAFSTKLEAAFRGPMHLVDERYSTSAAERSLLEADLSRKRRKELRDGVAAAWILQGFLDARNAEGAKQ